MSDVTVTREAVCSCGQPRATVQGEPVSVGVCHCLDCQRRTGGPFAAQARWKGERVSTEGRASRYTRVKASSTSTDRRSVPKPVSSS